jgi:hypothetical protein
MMFDSLLLLALGAGVPISARLGAAAAEAWVTRARARLTASASQLPAGTEVGGTGKDGTMWVARNQGAATTGAEVTGDR